jgi:hypothetical protein
VNEVFFSACTILIEKPEGDIRRHRLRWEGNIEIDLKEPG